MRGGNLNKIATFSVPTAGPADSLGTPTVVWTEPADLTDLFCAVEARRGMELIDPVTHQSYRSVIYRFRFRYQDVESVPDGAAILYEGKRYSVISKLPDEHWSQDTTFEAVNRTGGFGSSDGECIP